MVYALTVSISGCVQAKVKKIMAPMFTAGRIKSENARAKSYLYYYNGVSGKCQCGDIPLGCRKFPLTKPEILYKIYGVSEYMSLSRAVEGTAL